MASLLQPHVTHQPIVVVDFGSQYTQLIARRPRGMTADWWRLPSDLLARRSARLVNEAAGISRVVYDSSSKPPSTIEWE